MDYIEITRVCWTEAEHAIREGKRLSADEMRQLATLLSRAFFERRTALRFRDRSGLHDGHLLLPVISDHQEQADVSVIHIDAQEATIED